MGVAQTGPDRTKTRSAYLLVVALILFYREVRWLELLTR